MAVNALAVLVIAMQAWSRAPRCRLRSRVAGFASGIVAPSRDLIVRASTPPGAAGRVFGFVYSGLDVGSLATPVFYGWMLDHAPAARACSTPWPPSPAIAMLTVLLLPGRSVLVEILAAVKKA